MKSTNFERFTSQAQPKRDNPRSLGRPEIPQGPLQCLQVCRDLRQHQSEARGRCVFAQGGWPQQGRQVETSEIWRWVALQKYGGTPKWMVKIMENPMNKWMIWGGKHPYFWVDTQMLWCGLRFVVCIVLSQSPQPLKKNSHLWGAGRIWLRFWDQFLW